MESMYGNWLGVLRWSLAQTDGTSSSNFQPMSEKDKAWLTAALESVTVNEAQRMGELAHVLSAMEVPDGTANALQQPPVPHSELPDEDADEGEQHGEGGNGTVASIMDSENKESTVSGAATSAHSNDVTHVSNTIPTSLAVPSGQTTVASANQATVASGQTTVASGQTTVALGQTTVASGQTTVASGQTTVASGQTTVASANQANVAPLTQSTTASTNTDTMDLSISEPSAISTFKPRPSPATRALARLKRLLRHGATTSCKLAALSELSELVESLDNAKDLFIIGGFVPLLRCAVGKVSGNEGLSTDTNGSATVGTVIISNASNTTTQQPSNSSTQQASNITTTQLNNNSSTQLNNTTTTQQTGNTSHTGDARVRIAANEVLSTVLQNNPRAQAWALELHAFDELVHALATISTKQYAATQEFVCRERAAILTALSSLVRDNASGQAAVVQHVQGIVPLLLLRQPLDEWVHSAEERTQVQTGSGPSTTPSNAVSDGFPRVVRKAVFFLRHLLDGTSAANVATILLQSTNSPQHMEGQGRDVHGNRATGNNSNPASNHNSNHSTTHNSNHSITHNTNFISLALKVLKKAREIDEGDAESSDIREHILAILTAFASSDPEAVAVQDDSNDKRQLPRDRERVAAHTPPTLPIATAGHEEIETQPEAQFAAREAARLRAMGTGASPVVMSEALIVLPDPTASATYSNVHRPLTVTKRRELLRNPLYGVLAAMQEHEQWAVEKGREMEGGDGNDGYANEAEQTRVIRQLLQE